jgi:hypothetical protein
VRFNWINTPEHCSAVSVAFQAPTASADAGEAPTDVTYAFHPAATRDRPLLSRRSAGEATGGFKPARCFSSSAAKAAGVT